jgi:hypothetical protein
MKGFVVQLINKTSGELAEHAEAVLNWEQARDDQVKWVRENRWIDAAPWSYESAGPFIEYGDKDKRYDELLRPYLLSFLKDQCRTKSIEKPRQSEITENHINESFWNAITRPATNIAHVFPTQDLGNDISNEKIQIAVDESPLISDKVKRPYSVKRFKFKNSSIYSIIGAASKFGGRSTSRDVVIFDETDLIPESVFGIFERMLDRSSLRIVRYISTPTVPNIGIDARVQSGSGFEWLIRCPKCKKQQFFEFPHNLINFFEVSAYDPESPEYQKRLNKVYIGCRKCGHYIDRCSKYYLRYSKWVPAKPTLVGIHNSYYLTQFMIPWKTGKEMTRRYHELSDYVWQYFNEVLGKAYVKSGNQLTDYDIRKNCRPWGMIPARTAAMQCISVGIDWGERQSWVVVSALGVEAAQPHKRCVVYIEEINERLLKMYGFKGDSTEHELRAAQIIDAFNADIIINDANGIGVDRNTYLINRYPKRGWGAFFDTAEMKKQITQSKLLVPSWGTAGRKVTFSKLNVWREVQTEFRRELCLLPKVDGNRESPVQKFIQHHQALVIQPRWNEEYKREYEMVVKVQSEDHLADADMYSAVGCWKLMGSRSGRIPGVA